MSNHASILLLLKDRRCASTFYSGIRNGRPWSRTPLSPTDGHSLRASSYLAAPPSLQLLPAYRPYKRAENTAQRSGGGRRLHSNDSGNKALLQLESQLSSDVISYNKVLGQKSIECLTATEENYKRIALKLRRLILEWSALRLHPPVDERTREQLLALTPAQRAQQYLKQLEDLRLARAGLYLRTKPSTDSSRDEAEEKNPGVFGRIKNLFVADSADNSKPREQKVLKQAHRFRSYTTDAGFYLCVMKSFVYWHDHSYSSNSEQKSLKNDVPHNIIRKRKPQNDNAHDDEDSSLADSTRVEESIRQQRVKETINRLMYLRREMMRFHRRGNDFVKPTREVCHFVMNYCASTGCYHHVYTANRLLHEMVFQHRHKYNTPTKPRALNQYEANLSSYHIVLYACRNAARHDQKEGRKNAVLKAEELLLELESMQPHRERDDLDFKNIDQSDKESSKTGSHGLTDYFWNCHETTKLDLTTYRLVIHTLACAGHQAIPDMCKRIDAILFRMMGKTHFVDWIVEHEKASRGDKREHVLVGKNDSDAEPKRSLMPSKSHFEPDMLMLHFVLVSYASSKDPLYLNRAKHLLQLMKERRLLTLSKESKRPDNNKTRLSDADPKGINELYYPDTLTYNAIIEGLLYASTSALAKESSRAATKQDFSLLEEDAIYATSLLDDMMTHNSSFPDKTTFDNLLQLWASSKSKQAGKQAEELISRMEAQAACTNNCGKEMPKPNWIFYQKALECWAQSANANEPCAAQRALVLLDKIDAQCSSWSISQKDDKTGCSDGGQVLLNHHVFTAVINVCSSTRLNEDKPDALRIAFVVYNRMIENGVSPSFETYAKLLRCCQKFLPPDKCMELSKVIFDAACDRGMVDRRVLSELREANPQLYEEHRFHCDDSTGVSSKV